MTDRPNVLIILCDQLRADVLGCYGHPIVKTPNIDRLARSGVVFENAYSQTPVCIPARQNLLTGRHSHELELMENTRKTQDRFPPLATLLAQSGYHTAAVGKMHFHPPRTPYGFEHMELSEEMPKTRDEDDYLKYLSDHGFEHVHEPHGQRRETYYEPQISVLPAQHTTTAWTARRTAEFIRRSEDDKEPFFCLTGFIKPHPPFDPPYGFERMYDPRQIPDPPRNDADRDPKDHFLLVQTRSKWRERTADDKMRTIRSRYYGVVSHLDTEIAQIILTLEKTGQRQSTLIVLTSDHGDLLGDHHQYGKRSFFEASARVPLIVSWPDRLPAGQKRDHLAVLQDVFTTTLSACEVDVPDGVYGIDLIPAARDAKHPTRDTIIGEYGRLPTDTTTRNQADEGTTLKFMVRQGDWKYVYIVNGGREQLFNIAQSRDELNDLAQERPDLCREFNSTLVAHYANLPGPPFLENGKLPVRPFTRNPVLNEEFRLRNFQFPLWPDGVSEEKKNKQ